MGTTDMGDEQRGVSIVHDLLGASKGELTVMSVLASTSLDNSDISVTCFPAFLWAALNSLKFSTKFYIALGHLRLL